jgi:hypothetical protein
MKQMKTGDRVKRRRFALLPDGVRASLVQPIVSPARNISPAIDGMKTAHFNQ